LQNALKFTPSGGTVTVSLASDSGRVYLRVKDTGVGMEPGREQEKFAPFAQGDQGLARTKGGLGLGLSLVKLFVEKHGGTVSAAARGGSEGPRIILCDVGLPDIDGYEVARSVRAIPGLERVRLVALTGYAQPEDRERAKEAGFDAHLAKPPDPEALARMLSAEG
jgi:CheY-like chemotaxis protein